MGPRAIAATDLSKWQPAPELVRSKRSSASFKCPVLWKGTAVFHSLQLSAVVPVVKVHVSCSAQGGNEELLLLQLLPHFIGQEYGREKLSANSNIQ